MKNFLRTEDYVKIAREWDTKSIEELSEEFHVSLNTIRKAAAEMRKLDPTVCAKAKRKRREDLAREAIRLFKEQLV